MLFILFSVIGFIRPSKLEIQVFGLHITLFGGVFFIKDITVVGFLIMIIGLSLSVYACFKDESFEGKEGEDSA